MVMAGIEREQFLARNRVAKVELVRPDDVAFRADAEKLWLHRIEVELWGNWFFENRIQRFCQPLPRPFAIRGRILVTIRNPHIGDARLPQRLADGRANFSASDAVFDPEFSDGLAAVSQRKTIRRLRVRKERRIKIHSQP